MTATFGTDLVDKTKQAKVDACRARVQSAARAAKQLETDVRWLVKERAWEVLGYENFAEMWDMENGFRMPTHVEVLAVDTLRVEGMRPQGVKNGDKRVGGHRTSDVARMIGMPVYQGDSDGKERSPTVRAIIRQLDAGVPADRVTKSNGRDVLRTIENHGTRARQHSRRIGKGPDELVLEGFNVRRGDADEVAQIAREADVPKAEIYRQFVAEGLARYRESRPGEAS